MKTPDPVQLRSLADWFDKEDATGRWGDKADTNVQDDLREWAAWVEVVYQNVRELVVACGEGAFVFGGNSTLGKAGARFNDAVARLDEATT